MKKALIIEKAGFSPVFQPFYIQFAMDKQTFESEMPDMQKAKYNSQMN